MRIVNHSRARSMAQARWGEVHNSRHRWFNCSSHGGYIIPHEVLTPTQIKNISKYLPTEYALAIVDNKTGKVVKFRGPDSFRTISYNSYVHTAVEVPLFFGEEDCDWAVIEKFTKPESSPEALQTFWDWFDPTNPRVQERLLQDKARENHDPDLIISACRVDGGVCVTTADGTNYTLARYDNTIRWLSKQEKAQ